MSKLTCDVCNSDNIIKQDGIFICQNCGAKYSVADMQKKYKQISVNSEDENINKTKSQAQQKNKKSKSIWITLLWILIPVVVFIIGVNLFDSNKSGGVGSNSTPVVSSLSKNNNGNTSSQSTEEKIWVKKAYVDEFGDETSQTYLTCDILIGTFSNSATTNSSCCFKMLIDKSNIAIIILEYGYSIVKNPYSRGTEYGIQVKSEDGRIYKFYGTMNDDRIIIDDKDESSFLNVLKNNYSLKVYIEEYHTPSSSYNFTIKRGNLNEMLPSVNR